MRCVIIILLSTIILPGILSAQQVKNHRFLVITSHTPEECLAELNKISEKGEKILAKFDWGCMHGEHIGYAVIEAKDEAEAKAMLPTWKNVRLMKVGKFTIQQIKLFQEKVMMN